MQHSSLGYDKDAIVTVDIRQIVNNQDVFTNQIKEYSGIEDITYSEYLLSSVDTYMRFSIEIIGFMPDIKFVSFRSAVEPMAFYVPGTEWEDEPQNYAYIKLKAGTNLCAAMSHIHTTLAGFDTEHPFEVCFFDEVLQLLYEKEIALNMLITLFSLIAIFISIVRILLICFVIAAPLTWYAVSRWLQDFAYKTPMYWWVYLLAFAAVGIVTICTVTFQNWRVANSNPVEAIKND